MAQGGDRIVARFSDGHVETFRCRSRMFTNPTYGFRIVYDRKDGSRYEHNGFAKSEATGRRSIVNFTRSFRPRVPLFAEVVPIMVMA